MGRITAELELDPADNKTARLPPTSRTPTFPPLILPGPCPHTLSPLPLSLTPVRPARAPQGDVWHIAVPNLHPDVMYAFRVSTAETGRGGQRYLTDFILLDPYAKARTLRTPPPGHCGQPPTDAGRGERQGLRRGERARPRPRRRW